LKFEQSAYPWLQSSRADQMRTSRALKMPEHRRRMPVAADAPKSSSGSWLLLMLWRVGP